MSARQPDPDTALWRVRVGNDRYVVPFHTERGARTSAAIQRTRPRPRAGDDLPMVQHREHPGEPWHDCPGGEQLHGARRGAVRI